MTIRCRTHHVLMATITRDDIELQKKHDLGRRSCSWEVVKARWEATVRARDADTLGEEGADWAYRQALIDLGAACELLAGPMKAPHRKR